MSTVLRFEYVCPDGHPSYYLAENKPDGVQCDCGAALHLKRVVLPSRVSASEWRRVDGINGVQMTEGTRKQLEFPLGKKNVENLHTVKDVDKKLADIAKKYPAIMQEPPSRMG